MNRRKFLKSVGTSVIAMPFIGSLVAGASNSVNINGHFFPELGYGYNALEPYIDAKTMEIHYTKHHRGYFDNFIKVADSTDLMTTSMELIFSKMSQYSTLIRNNGGGYYNHNLFWENMTPVKTEISNTMKTKVETDFGSFEKFKEEFSAAAKSRFGSGWAWLSVDKKDKLFVSSSPNQDNPLMDVAEKQGIPLLGLDVWEHAYYLNYQNKRADYVDNFWNIVNWKVVEQRFLKATR